MTQFKKLPNQTVDEYLAHEEHSNARHEYIDGQTFAMVGGTQAHNLIAGHLHALLHTHLRGSACRAFMTDMKVNVEVANSFYYPDVMVTCEPFDGKSVCTRSPVLIAEVLSRSTAHIDRREKLVAYRRLSSLCQYLIIHQDRFRIEVFRKDDEGQWEVVVLEKNDFLSIDSLPSRLNVAIETIYEGVTFDPVVEEEDEIYVTARQ